MTEPIVINLLDPAFRANPHPTYARLRAEAPVYRATLPDGRALWVITRYDDVSAVVKDERLIKNWRNVMSPEQRAAFPLPDQGIASDHLLFQDPPDHTRLRTLVHKAFTTPFVNRLRERIQEIADQLVLAVKARGHMDLIKDYAFPLPILVIAEMLGVPVEDRSRIREWSSTITEGGLATKEEYRSVKPALDAFAEYVHSLCDARRSAPRDDLISALVHAEEEGQKLNQAELDAMVFLLILAGHETTANLIGNGMLALFDHPDQFAKLRADPSLIQSAVEELLRFEGPLTAMLGRFAKKDVDFGGVVIPRGDQVMVAIASANRDAARFVDPDHLDITRSDNKHLAFGHGIHYCLGAPLARLEGQIGIATLLRHLPGLRLATPREELRFGPTLVVRRLVRLPVGGPRRRSRRRSERRFARPLPWERGRVAGDP